MRLTAALFESIAAPFTDERTLPAQLAAKRTQARPPQSMIRRYHMERLVFEGEPALRFSPRKQAPTAHLIYFHGGAYILPMVRFHWWVIDHLIRHTGAAVTVPSYPLAPEHTVDEATAVVKAAVDHVIAEADGLPVVFAGDSAGAGIALAHQMRRRALGIAGADALILFSPWGDGTISNPDIASVDSVDRLLSREYLVTTAKWWAGSRSTADLLISPLLGDLTGLPPTLITTAEQDILFPDALRLMGKLRRAGNQLTYIQEPDGFHDYILLVWSEESKRAFAKVAELMASLRQPTYSGEDRTKPVA